MRLRQIKYSIVRKVCNGEGQAALLHGDAGLELFIRVKKRSKKNIQETEGERQEAMDLARHPAKHIL